MTLYVDLLAQANMLAICDPGKPKQANLRRAVSAAYYSIFHLFVSEGASVMGSKLSAIARTRLRRAFGHGQMKEVCSKYFAATTAASFTLQIAPLLSFPLDVKLKSVAGVFVDMQEARHAADYDVSTKLTRIDVLSMIADVEAAIPDWKSIRKTDNAKVFLIDMLMRKAWARA